MAMLHQRGEATKDPPAIVRERLSHIILSRHQRHKGYRVDCGGVREGKPFRAVLASGISQPRLSADTRGSARKRVDWRLKTCGCTCDSVRRKW